MSCYRPGELKAGKTFFLYSFLGLQWGLHVEEYIVAGKSDPMPGEGEILRYRVNPDVLTHCDCRQLYKTRKSALRAAKKVAADFYGIRY